MAMVNDYLCDPNEVAALANAYLGGELTGDSDQVLSACSKVAARFRGAIRHHLTLQEDVELWLDGTGTCFLRLPVLRPRGVSVFVNDEPVQVVGVSRAGLLQFAEPLPRLFGCVRVVIQSCGVEEVPAEVASAVATAAVMEISHQPGIQSMQVGSVNVVYGATGTTGTREEWETVVEKWRIQVGDRA